jgi:hypothetical protein
VTLLQEHDALVALGLREGRPTGIDHDNLVVTSSHNHNTAYYSTPGWGTWIFQDVFDLRNFEYMAERMARAVIDASDDLRPVRVGGTTVAMNEISSHSYGPKVATDGTPAGFPYDFTTKQLSLVRFDDVTDPADPQPYAVWLVKGVHPEWTWGDDLINGDIVTAGMRLIDRELGVTTVWSHRETGTSGPHKDRRAHEPEARREFQETGMGRLDIAGRLLADSVRKAWDDIEHETPEDPHAFAPFTTDAEVGILTQRFAPPPTGLPARKSNCNTDRIFEGDPGVPIMGLPDCGFPLGGLLRPLFEALPVDFPGIYEDLKRSGVPIPETYAATGVTGVEETAAVHLAALRIGDIAATFCPCEQHTEQALNIQSRLDRVDGNLFLGWDWFEQTTPAGRDWCVQAEDTTWTCADPRNPANDLAPVPDHAIQRMRAQIHNDAAGWETDATQAFGEAEPWDPAAIKGNFTHEEHTEHGYGLALAVGMANDYWGYVPDYRDHRSHDHYRKALNGFGPRGQDWIATRVSRMAASLNGGPAFTPGPLDVVFTAESLRAQAVADALGALSRHYTAVYEPTLPADGGPPRIVEQPADVRRFDAAHLRFVGGSNWTDLPDVRVERLVDGAWEPFGDTTGEVQLLVDFPEASDLPTWRAGQFEWVWTATFEAYVSEVEVTDPAGRRYRSTPEGTYRFVVEGQHRSGPARVEPYDLTSETFTVSPWDGITVTDLAVDGDGAVRFAVGPDATYTFDEQSYAVGPIAYPATYDSPFRQIREGGMRRYTYGLADPARHQLYCIWCSFRSWAMSAEVASATVTVERADGSTERVAAALDEASGRWVAPAALGAGDRAWVGSGDVVDTSGERNGEASAPVTGG